MREKSSRQQRRACLGLAILCAAFSANAATELAPSQSAKIINLQDYWFSTAKPVLRQQKNATEAAQPFAMAPSCGNYASQNQGIESASSVQAFLQDNLALNAKTLAAGQSLFKDYSQFWSLKNEYYQMVAEWNYDVPARYRVSMYRSTDASFQRDVEVLPVADKNSHSLDALSVETLFAQTAAGFEKKGAQRGSTIRVASVQERNNQFYEITLLNDLPVKLVSESIKCSVAAPNQTMDCSCDSEDAALSTTHSAAHSAESTLTATGDAK